MSDTERLTEALERFSQSLPVIAALPGDVRGTSEDERNLYAEDAWQIVKAARAHVGCGTVTDEMVEGAAKTWIDAFGWGENNPFGALEVYALMRTALEAAVRVREETK